MASMKAEKPVGTQLFGQVKKEPAAAKTGDGASKTSTGSKAAPKKAAPKTNQEPKRKVELLFFFSIFWGFFPLFNAIFAFPQERPMLIKERSSGMYRLSSYYFARMAGDLPMQLVLPTIFVTITYWMGVLKPSLATFLLNLLIILFNVLVSQGLGLALSAILMDVKQATTLASVTMLVFLPAGGYYIQHIPPFIDWLKYISFSHYCYKLLIGVQYSETELDECGLGVHCRVLDFLAIKFLGIDDKGLYLAALTVMSVGYRLFGLRSIKDGATSLIVKLNYEREK